MAAQPRIKLPLTAIDKMIDRIGLVLLIIIWGFAIYSFFNSPEIIPIHFDASGRVNGYGNKWTIFILPALSTFISIALAWLNKYPHLFNYPATITLANAGKQYFIATRMLRVVRLSILIIILLIVIFTHLNSLQVVKGVGTWFLPFIAVIMLLPVIIGLNESFKKVNK